MYNGRLGECREDETELGGRQSKLLSKRWTGHRDVHPIDVCDEVPEAQDKQNEVPDPHG